jgi:hypothetical protein
MSWRVLLASICRCLMCNDAGFQCKGNHLSLAQFPSLPLWIPLAACLLHPLSYLDCSEANTQVDTRVCWYPGSWRLPGPLGDKEFDSLETRLVLRIIPITHTDKPLAVRCEELPGTLLARLEMQKSAHTYLTNASAPAQGQRRAEQNPPGWPARAGLPRRVRPPYAPSHA